VQGYQSISGSFRVNFLVNYGWEWDLNLLKMADPAQKNVVNHIKSAEVSRIDLIIRKLVSGPGRNFGWLIKPQRKRNETVNA